MDYVALGEVILDDVRFPGGEPVLGQLGGVTYTLAGMRVWSDSVGLCGGIGRDLDPGWFLSNGISLKGTRVRAERGPHSAVNYFENGEREELPLPGCATIASMKPDPQEMPGEYRGCKGLYWFGGVQEEDWSRMDAYLKRDPATLIFEILGEAARPENADAIRRCLSIARLFSLNLTEGRRLCGLEDPVAIAKELSQWGAHALLLRMGAAGALVANRRQIWRLSAAPAHVVDVTGGGNSSTGGFLVGYCESGGDLVTAGKWAAAAASLILEQYGVPDRVDAGRRELAKQRSRMVRAERLR